MEKLGEAVDDFVYWLEKGQFLTWEAVVCREQGLPLTAQQEKSLGKLISFNDEEDDEILYIDEIPRPSEPWYVILNRIVPHLLIEPFGGADIQNEVQADGWRDIAAALEQHGRGVVPCPRGCPGRGSQRPDSSSSPWLQYCFNDLAGLGGGLTRTKNEK